MTKDEYKQRDYEFLKKLIHDELVPVIELQIKHDTVLHGKDYKTGLVQDVERMKTTIANIKWLLNFLGISFLSSSFFLIIKLWSK